MGGGGKESPRQKMIGMMYLVLTALLAMNTSKQVLQGYLSVNESLETSKSNLEENNKRVTEAFKASVSGNAAAGPYLKVALEAQKEIEEAYHYIHEVKSFVIADTEPNAQKNEKIADTLNLRRMEKIDDYDVPTHVLGLAEPKTPAEGKNTARELRNKLTKLSESLIAKLDKMQKDPATHLLKDDYEGLKKKLGSIKPVDSKRVEDGIEFNWEMDNFYHLPLAAVVTSFNKLQGDLKNVEAEMLQVLSGASGKLAIKFDHLEAKVIAPSSYIQAGQPYVADIMLAASSSKMGSGDLEFHVGGSYDSLSKKFTPGNILKIENGMGKYEAGTGGEGDQTFKGVIKFKKPDGSFDYYPFEQSYKVAKSGATVSADQMNVFYAGVPNPVTASAAGISPADISVNATGAGVKVTPQGNGKYEFTFTGVGECNVSVSAKTKDGVKPQGPPIKFRVKPLPKPEVKVGPKFAPAEIKKNELAMVGGLGAGANGFDFQANFVVISYEITGKVKGKLQQEEGSGNNLSSAASAIFKGADVGTKVYIDAKVKGPDGKITGTTCGIKVIK
jgi:gliding motility-associated protein GldM